jgi:Nucleotidyltransferase substrate binding protein like.
LYRFSKLQDSIGQKLFKAVLDYKKEETSNKSFIDIMNKLEQLEYIQDIEGWFKLRDIRNQLSHEYEDDLEELVTIINKIFISKDLLESYYFKVIQKLNS